jgi:hypothetical protein
LTAPSRRLARVARQLADQQEAKRNEFPRFGIFFATATTVTPGGASDGNALLKVTYRDQEFPVAYFDVYTPSVGDRVLCVSVSHQPIAIGRVIGHP